MPVDTVHTLIDLLQQHQLLDAEVLQEVKHVLAARFPEPRNLARELLQRDWLTAYQINQLFQGRGAELTLGNYVFLERLGEGGMGAVFKARHRRLGHIVALKLIRKERLSHANTLRRFRREMEAASKLEHANIVRALDANESDGILYFAMEYVEGIDLAKLVKQQGPLPILEACGHIRQAALGLQHAHERGLVHRDIKPANLLLAKSGVVKVLDMGLARLHHDDSAEHSATLTQEGFIVGTPDFIAPEQAINSHNVDIRADLYSLGCTFYYLLCGKVPFGGGTLTEKLIKHQLQAPTALGRQRPDVPPQLAAVVEKLMAKRPADRYQTPGELATILSAPLSTAPTFVDSFAETHTDILRAPQAARVPARWPLGLLAAGAAVLLAALLIPLLAVLAWKWGENRTGKAVLAKRDDKAAVQKGEEPPSTKKAAETEFKSLFNGKDLTGWQGAINIVKRKQMSQTQLTAAQTYANESTLSHWTVFDGVLTNYGAGDNLATVEEFSNFELVLDWKIEAKGDTGVYLRGFPQVQIWDSDETPGAKGLDVGSGSGGLWNNVTEKNGKRPLKKADNPVGEWNTMYIVLKGDKVTVKLNGQLVVDNATLENALERGKPLPARGPIELQKHTGMVKFKNISIRELPD